MSAHSSSTCDATSGLDADDVHRVVYALLLLGIIAATEQRPAPLFELDVPFLAQEPAPAPPPPRPVPAKAAVDAATADDVMAAYLDGKEMPDRDQLAFGPHDEVALVIGKAPAAVPDRFDFPEGY